MTGGGSLTTSTNGGGNNTPRGRKRKLAESVDFEAEPVELEGEVPASKRLHGGEEEKAESATTTAIPRVPKAVNYWCNYCQRDITYLVRIRCSECEDFDLCVPCYSVGVEMSAGHGRHVRTHRYQVFDSMAFPLYDAQWAADEEVMLLDGIKRFGLGNWVDIADFMGTKDAAACKEHYFRVYVDREAELLPPAESPFVRSHADYVQLKRELVAENAERIHTLGEGSASSKPSASSSKDKRAAPSAPTSNPVASVEMAGYMPKRGEFDVEWDNDLECLVADMAFEEGEDEANTQLKLAIIDIFNQRILERIERRQFMKQNQLLEPKSKSGSSHHSGSGLASGTGAASSSSSSSSSSHHASSSSASTTASSHHHSGDRKRSKDDKEVSKKYCQFLQVIPKEEYDKLISGIQNQMVLARRIKQLQQWRAMGVRSIAEGEMYESEARAREERRSMSRSASSSALWRSGRSRGPDFGWCRLESTSSAAGSALARSSRPKQTVLDLTGSPRVELLSRTERTLCSELAIFPTQYLQMKEALVLESLRRPISRSTALRLLKLPDQAKATTIYTFFQRQGFFDLQ